ncbi:hypothetical protein BOTBODRAFT_116889 [Botryobasidium botryosum FD-172 SS1]|uniref:RRM domain-containing protein n=1 Tax=Botryobasidium botryosum (strain FD-172 SS1) TaxID=930990 RepID=A0A067MDC5_BOTB1|nr:hypothetical protein BOTBODRAFT_116889 [Botryobasidium botryosum FD-172 SS1]
MAIDKSLDDVSVFFSLVSSTCPDSPKQIISTNKPKRNNRPRNSAPARTNAPNSAARQRYAGAVPAQNVPAAAPVANARQGSSTKIIVSNLPADVNEAQIKELFQATVGQTRDVNLHFDANGRSKGVAVVTFSRKDDGTKAYEQFNNRLIDGS